MPDGSIIGASDDILREAPTVTVYTRQYWTQDWGEATRVSVNTIRWGCSPEGSSGTFEIDCGAGWTRENPSNYYHLEQVDYLGHYVKVTVQRADYSDESGTPVTPEPIYWYGIISEDGGVRDGVRDVYGIAGAGGEVTRVLTRLLTLQAIGLESLFDKVIIDRIYTKTQSGGTPVVQVRVPFAFNEPNNFDGDGNRSVTTAATGVYVFTDDLENGEAWTTQRIVEYLIEYFQPVDWSGESWLPCSLTVNGLATLPTWDQPLVPCEGRTLRDLLNQLCDRRRNMAWRVIVDEDVGEAEEHDIKIDVFSFNPAAITLPSGAQQAENFNLAQIDFDNAIDVRASLTESIRHKADQVIVRGARKRSCFSISTDDLSLEKDWTTTAETEYKAGPSPLPAGNAEIQRAVIEHRRQDDLARVYAYFKVPDDWDFEVGDGLGGAASAGAPGGRGDSTGGGYVYIDPEMDDEDEWGYLPALRFLRTLFREMLTTAPDSSAQDGPPPFGVIEIEDGTFRMLDQLAETAGILDRGPGKGRAWSASVKMRADAPGIIVRVNGAQQLVIAQTDFPNDSEEDTTYEEASQLDYNDMIITVAAETFGFVLAKWPATADIVAESADDQATLIYVDIGEAGHLDYIVQNTVTGLDDGELVRDDGGYVRDDREWMEDLARFVFEWYGVERQAFTFSMEQILDLLTVGELVTEIGSGDLVEAVNSVVVAVTFDFIAQKTSVDTAFSNLDTDTLVDWFGNDARTIARSRRQS